MRALQRGTCSFTASPTSPKRSAGEYQAAMDSRNRLVKGAILAEGVHSTPPFDKLCGFQAELDRSPGLPRSSWRARSSTANVPNGKN